MADCKPTHQDQRDLINKLIDLKDLINLELEDAYRSRSIEIQNIYLKDALKQTLKLSEELQQLLLQQP